MREEIEAAALFITRLVNKNLQQSKSCTSTASSIHSHSSSASSSLSSSASTSSTSSDSPPDLDEQSHLQSTTSNNGTVTTNNNHGVELDKVEQFRQCLTEALYERFNNHWFPEQPSKGQAYRCIRLNEWDRRDITLQKACTQCGIDYKDLQLPVELTLWVDPDEVTCRFGENKGSHCLVAKFKDGELKDNNIDIDINNIDIEIFGQAAAVTANGDRMQHHLQQSHHHNHSLHGSPQQHNRSTNGINGTYQYMNHSNSSSSHSHHQHHHQQHYQSPQQQHHQPSSPQQPPHQHHHHQNHRATNHLGKTASAAIVTSPYHGGYTTGSDPNGNPIPSSHYYYF